MRKHLPSETALKVAHSVLTLGHLPEWRERLPAGTAELTEELLLAAELPRYTPRVINAARRPFMARAYRINDRILPGLFEGLGRRKCQINDWALEAIKDGCRQVVVVGAGFDTLALRLAPQHPETRFFEVDHPATARAKEKAVLAHGKPDNVDLLAVDLATTPLPDAMKTSDAWRPQDKTLFIAEGLLMYLTDAQVNELFLNKASCSPRGSRIAFSHCSPTWAKSYRGRLSRGAVALLGEPIQSWVSSEELPGVLEGTGWRVISDVDTDRSPKVEHFALAQRV